MSENLILWSISSSLEDGNVSEFKWSKGDKWFKEIVVHQYAYSLIESNKKPKFPNKEPVNLSHFDFFPMGGCVSAVDLKKFWVFCNGIDTAEQERLIQLQKNRMFIGLTEEGWESEISQTYAHPLNIERYVKVYQVKDSSRELTEFFPADINPIRKGFYEVRMLGPKGKIKCFMDWDGRNWKNYRHDNTPIEKNVLEWRGLNYERKLKNNLM
jgi:hypothetical protein